MKSKLIALSAISAGFVGIILTVGAYFELIDLFTLVISSVFVILPLYYNSFKSAFLTFLAGGVIAFLFSGFNIFTVVFPAYFLFFGLYPIVKFFTQDKRVNKTLFFILGLVWCVLSIFGIYYFYVFVMKIPFDGIPKFIADYIEVFIGLLGVVFYLVYDRYLFVMRSFTHKYLSKIIK